MSVKKRRQKRKKQTLEEIIKTTPPEAWKRTPEDDEWLNAPPVGREWPNPGWDDPLPSTTSRKKN